MKTSKKYLISDMYVDSDGYLSLKNLTALMDDASYSQSGEVDDKVDMSRLRWIIYQRDIEIKDPIKLGDEIEITTVPTNMERFYAYREFFVQKEGKLVVKARAVFMLIDIDRLRPIKIPKAIMQSYGNEEVTIKIDKLKYSKDLDYVKDIQIRKADIDANLHVNNTVYFDFAKEITGVRDKDIRYINLVYRNEIRNKDFVKGYCKKEGDIIDYSLKSTEGDTVYSLGKIKLNV